MLTKAEHPDWQCIPSPHFNSPMPRPLAGYVIHYTAAGSGLATAKYFARKEVSWTEKGVVKTAKVQASAHFVITRDGQVIQCVSIKDRAWHAGKSTWPGKGSDCNSFSIGIELANWGSLTQKKDGTFRTYTGAVFSGRTVKVAGTWWEAYPAQQITALVRLLETLESLTGVAPSRENVTGHEHIAPGRKTDPGPAFPWNDLWVDAESEDDDTQLVDAHKKRHLTEFR